MPGGGKNDETCWQILTVETAVGARHEREILRQRHLEVLAAVDLQAMMIRIQGLVNEIEQDPSRFVYRQPQPVE